MFVSHKFDATFVSVAVAVSLIRPLKAKELDTESVAVTVSAMVDLNVGVADVESVAVAVSATFVAKV
jgi:hypothetical protein